MAHFQASLGGTTRNIPVYEVQVGWIDILRESAQTEMDIKGEDMEKEIGVGVVKTGGVEEGEAEPVQGDTKEAKNLIFSCCYLKDRN